MAAEVTGYALREAIKVWTLRHSAVSSQFNDSLKAFPNEKKPKPTDVAAQIRETENAIAHLQTAQTWFNLQVKVLVDKEEMPLSEAVKRLGGAGRLEKMWRSAASVSKDRYSYDKDTRDATAVISSRTISLDDALKEAKAAAVYAGRLRAEIAAANVRKVNIPFLKPELLDTPA